MIPEITRIQTRAQQQDNVPKPYREVAKGLETQFINMMLQEMRKTINQEEPDSSAMDYYNSMLDNERAQIMAEKDGGIGIQKLVLDQIYPHHLRVNKQSIDAYKKINSEPLKEAK